MKSKRFNSYYIRKTKYYEKQSQQQQQKRREKCWFDEWNEIREAKKIKSMVPTSVARFHEHENICFVCLEKFDVYYNDDNESWMLMNALNIHDLFFHPICYFDYNKDYGN